MREMVGRLGDWSMRTEDGSTVPLPDAAANGGITARLDGSAEDQPRPHGAARL